MANLDLDRFIINFYYLDYFIKLIVIRNVHRSILICDLDHLSGIMIKGKAILIFTGLMTKKIL